MKELNTIQVRLNAPKKQKNQYYPYRSAEDILEALKPLLKETGCTVTLSDEISQTADRIYVKATATITNSEGEQVSTCGLAREELSNQKLVSAQITGTCSSYARKYALNGLFAIDDCKDIDSEVYDTIVRPARQVSTRPAAEPKQPMHKEEVRDATTDSMAVIKRLQKAESDLELVSSKQQLALFCRDYIDLQANEDFRKAVRANQFYVSPKK